MTTPSPTPAQMQKARALFDELATDITDRQGLGDEWQEIDDAVMNDELMPEWLAIFARALADAEREAWNAACEKCAGECVDIQDAIDCRKLVR